MDSAAISIALFAFLVGCISTTAQESAHRDREPSGAEIDALVQELGHHSKGARARAALIKIRKPAIPALIAAVRNGDNHESLRWEAATLLGTMGKDAVQAIPDLIWAVNDWEKRQKGKHPSHRTFFHAAQWALRRITLGNREAVPHLAEVLKEEEHVLRFRVMALLAELGSIAAAAVPDLAILVRSEPDDMRDAAARTLTAIGAPAKHAVPALVDALRGMSVQQVSRTLIGIGGPAVPALTDSLQNGGALRVEVCRILGEIGPAAGGAVPQLRVALRDRKPEVRWRAAEALGKIGENARAAVPELNTMLKDRSPLVRVGAAGAICRIDPRTEAPAVAVLIEALQSDAPWWIRASAAESIRQLGAGGTQATAGLAAMVCDETVNVRRPAARALAAIGPGAKEAVPALTEALGDEYLATGVAAARALVQIDPQNCTIAIPVLVSGLSDGARAGREAAEVLAMIGSPALPSLLDALQGEDRRARIRAAESLGLMGPPARDAVGPLMATLKEQDHRVQRPAARALGKIGPEARDAVPLLEELLKDRYVRAAAAGALGSLRPEALTKSMDLFIEALHGGEGWSRRDAADILGDLGPAAKGAIPALQELRFDDCDRSVRDAAASALRRILGNK